jgi:hypothetical protein
MNRAWRISCLAALAMTGCGQSVKYPETAAITGEVRYKGEPLTGVAVVFQAESGPSAVGQTDGQGRFSVATNQRPGAVIGDHKVYLRDLDQQTATDCSAVAPPVNSWEQPGLNNSVASRFPTKYTNPEQSPLKAIVMYDGQTFELELTD